MRIFFPTPAAFAAIFDVGFGFGFGLYFGAGLDITMLLFAREDLPFVMFFGFSVFRKQLMQEVTGRKNAKCFFIIVLHDTVEDERY